MFPTLKLKWLFLALICSSQLILTACVSSSSKTADGVNNLAAEKQYDKAIESYEKLIDEEKDNVNIDKIKQRRSSYEKDIIIKASKLNKNERFVEALALIDEAEKNIPSSVKLSDSRSGRNGGHGGSFGNGCRQKHWSVLPDGGFVHV